MDSPKETKLDEESRRDLDSLFRFYGSQITAHSNYLVAYAFAVAVYFYKWLDRLMLVSNKPPLVYDLALYGLIPVFILLGLFFAGRLIYYTELSNLVQNFMGFYHCFLPHYSKFIELVQKEKERGCGLDEVIAYTLYFRIRFLFSERLHLDMKTTENYVRAIQLAELGQFL